MDYEASESSSSSSSSSSQSNEDSSDYEVDEALAYEIRTALHLAVGKICRAEEKESCNSSGTNNNNNNTSSSVTTMSKEAIVALTDLTYHYATSCFANDMVSFSKHAKRQTVKTEDVLLMARKDKNGMLSELKRIMNDNPDVYTENSKKKGGLKAALQKRKNVTAKIAKQSNNKSKTNGKAKGIGKGKKGKKDSILSSSSSSSFSSSSSDDGGGIDILKQRRKTLELERAKQKKALKSKSTFRKGKAKDDGSDLADFIVNNDSFDTNNTSMNNSSSSDEIEFDAAPSKKKKGDKKKHKTKDKKKSSALFELDGDSDDNNMVIIDD